MIQRNRSASWKTEQWKLLMLNRKNKHDWKKKDDVRLYLK